ncbi:glutathione S-transferase II [Rhizodiscina lignyota]|uniref:Glutathione S-transferase II n=1 Tax=Rhizodiscina lignyota TaxID=1504668 RepID=A0A9P4MGF7_9PEZI|nr:glutathione S-transferase II [Rhizodiscina lignyota]
MASGDRPTGLIANKGIELLTFGTPNGVKASIMLEELKETYGMDYTFQGINIMQNIQKEPWFTKLGPNGRIPVIVDHDKGDYAVMEGLAILNYLTKFYDPEHKFSFTDDLDICTAEQWMAWQHGGMGPMQGQAGQYYRFLKERIPHPTQRYVGETERLYGVLDARLAGRDYIAGQGKGKYSIADINTFGWVNGCGLAGINLEQFPNVYAWWERVRARPAVEKGLSVPSGAPSPFGWRELQKKRAEDPEAAKAEEPLKEALEAAKKQYNYVYKSP